jgi:hypothetical protein
MFLIGYYNHFKNTVPSLGGKTGINYFQLLGMGLGALVSGFLSHQNLQTLSKAEG